MCISLGLAMGLGIPAGGDKGQAMGCAGTGGTETGIEGNQARPSSGPGPAQGRPEADEPDQCEYQDSPVGGAIVTLEQPDESLTEDDLLVIDLNDRLSALQARTFEHFHTTYGPGFLDKLLGEDGKNVITLGEMADYIPLHLWLLWTALGMPLDHDINEFGYDTVSDIDYGSFDPNFKEYIPL